VLTDDNKELRDRYDASRQDAERAKEEATSVAKGLLDNAQLIRYANVIHKVGTSTHKALIWSAFTLWQRFSLEIVGGLSTEDAVSEHKARVKAAERSVGEFQKQQAMNVLTAKMKTEFSRLLTHAIARLHKFAVLFETGDVTLRAARTVAINTIRRIMTVAGVGIVRSAFAQLLAFAVHRMSLSMDDSAARQISDARENADLEVAAFRMEVEQNNLSSAAVRVEFCFYRAMAMSCKLALTTWVVFANTDRSNKETSAMLKYTRCHKLGHLVFSWRRSALMLCLRSLVQHTVVRSHEANTEDEFAKIAAERVRFTRDTEASRASHSTYTAQLIAHSKINCVMAMVINSHKMSLDSCLRTWSEFSLSVDYAR
jgi:hypothetical protein